MFKQIRHERQVKNQRQVEMFVFFVLQKLKTIKKMQKTRLSCLSFTRRAQVEMFVFFV